MIKSKMPRFFLHSTSFRKQIFIDKTHVSAIMNKENGPQKNLHESVSFAGPCMVMANGRSYSSRRQFPPELHVTNDIRFIRKWGPIFRVTEDEIGTCKLHCSRQHYHHVLPLFNLFTGRIKYNTSSHY